MFTIKTLRQALGSDFGLGSASPLGPSVASQVRKGTRELLMAYEESPFLRMCAGRVADSMASAEWMLFRKRGRASTASASRLSTLRYSRDVESRGRALRNLVKQQVLEPLEQHPLLDLLQRGNEIHDGHTVRRSWQLHYDLAGDAIIIVLREPGTLRPNELVPMPPHWVKETPRPGQENVFVVQPEGSSLRREIPGEDVLWLSDVSPLNPYGRGASIARALGDEIDQDDFASRTLKQHYINGARPDVVVTIPDIAKREDLERFEQKWLSKLQGFWNWGRPHFLNREVKIDTVQRQLDDFEKVRPGIQDVIMQVWGIPPEIFGKLNSSNRATIESAFYLYALNTLLPRLERQRHVLQRRLVPMFEDGESLLLDYVSPVPEDLENRRIVMAAHPAAFLVDEIREAAGSEELPDEKGQVFVFPMGLSSSELPGGEPDSEDMLGGEPPEDDDGEEDGFNLAMRTVSRAPITDAFIQRALRAIRLDELVSAANPVVEETVKTFGEEMIERLSLGIEFRLDDPVVEDFLKRRGTERLSRVNRVTKRKIVDLLVEGQKEGKQIADMANAIGEVFKASRGKRSLVIAQTETVKASNFGVNAALKQGGVSGKQWLSSRDDNVRHSHQELDGTVVGVNDNFTSPVTGASGPHPGDLGLAKEDINCFVPETEVSGAFVAGLEARYSGPMVDIKTASGRTLTVTPNHPIASLQGLVPAQKLGKGQQLLCHVGPRNDSPVRSVEQEKDRCPARIDEVFRALLAGGDRLRTRVGSEDLHGDAARVDGDVDVVLAAGFLAGDAQTQLRERIDQFKFPVAKSAAARLRSAFKRDLGIGAASSGLPSAGELSFNETSVLSNDVPLQALRVGPAADWDACRYEASGEDRASDPGLVADLIQGYPGEVLLDEVIEVRYREWSGHVYDLQSVSGFVVANGIVASNCRCTMLAQVDERSFAKSEARRKKLWKAHERRRQPFERIMRRGLRAAFARQMRAVRAVIQEESQ